MDLDLSRSYAETWNAMESLVDQGKTRLIGRCSLTGQDILQIMANT